MDNHHLVMDADHGTLPSVEKKQSQTTIGL